MKLRQATDRRADAFPSLNLTNLEGTVLDSTGSLGGAIARRAANDAADPQPLFTPKHELRISLKHHLKYQKSSSQTNPNDSRDWNLDRVSSRLLTMATRTLKRKSDALEVTPPAERSPKKPKITGAQKQALVDNLQLEGVHYDLRYGTRG